MTLAIILVAAMPGHHKEVRDKWLPVVQAAAEYYKIDWHLIDALIYAESHWDPNAESHVGAQGLTQLMPETAKSLHVTDPFDPGQAIWGGAWYLRQMYDYFDCWHMSLAAYNAGPGAVKRYNGIPPYKETIMYVTKIVTKWEQK